VCEGYAKTMEILLEKAGIETYYVTGKANGGGHAWNIVKLDGDYFHIDTTWDDPVPNREGEISYKYFLVPSSFIKQDHSWNEQKFPTARSKKFEYFREFYSVKESGSYYYYSNNKDGYKLYRIKKDGTGKKKILNMKAPYFVLTKNAIYFSNYSKGGYLYKSNLEGSKAVQLNKKYSIDLYLKGNRLFFTNKKTNKIESLKIS